MKKSINLKLAKITALGIVGLASVYQLLGDQLVQVAAAASVRSMWLIHEFEIPEELK